MNIDSFAESLRLAGFREVPAQTSQQSWTGTISGYDLRIDLPQAFPYLKPRVTPDAIRGSRHQEYEGALCLYPDDSSDSWMPFYTADHLVERITAWLQSYEQGFDEDSEEGVLDEHLYYLQNSELIVYADDWQKPPDTNLGAFGLWTLRDHVYIASGLTANSTTHPQLSPIVTKLFTLRSQALFRTGIWLFTAARPQPASNLQDLLTNIEASGGPSKQQVQQAITGKIGWKLRQPTAITLAVAFEDGGATTWLFLEFTLSKGWVEGAARVKIAAYEPAPAAKEQLQSRVGATTLTGKTVVLFGCGSLGSMIAMLLARQGVERLDLVDSDSVRPGNVVRHEAGLWQTGLSKTNSVRYRISQTTPSCEVTTHTRTWTPTKIEELINGADYTVCATGSPAFEYLVDSLAVTAGKPALYVGAYINAKLGRINIVRPGIDPCLQCILRLKDEDSYPLIPFAKELVVKEIGCNDFTSIASAVDLEAIAIEAVRSIACLSDSTAHNLSDVLNTSLEEERYRLAPAVIRERYQPSPACSACARFQRQP